MLLVQVGIQGLKRLSAASVLQKLCLFNCKLGQEASDTIVSCFKDKGFASLQELDLTGNEIEASQMQSVLEVVQQQNVAPALKVHSYSIVVVYNYVWQPHPPSWLTRVASSHTSSAMLQHFGVLIYFLALMSVLVRSSAEQKFGACWQQNLVNQQDYLLLTA